MRDLIEKITLNELKDKIFEACDKGYGDIQVDIVQHNSCVDDGCPVIGLRCVTDCVKDKIKKYVSIIES